MSGGAILFRGGRIIDAAQQIDGEGDVLVVNGRVAKVAVGRTINPPSGARVVDCGGKIVAPGLIDPHVHLREPGGEAKETVKLSAAESHFSRTRNYLAEYDKRKQSTN